MDFVDLARFVNKKSCNEDMEKFFLIAWRKWYRRNQKVIGGDDYKLEMVIDHVMSMHKDFFFYNKETFIE